MTKAEIEKNKQKILLATLAKANGVNVSSDEEKKGSDSDDDIQPNLNHLRRDQELAANEDFDEVIDGT